MAITSHTGDRFQWHRVFDAWGNKTLESLISNPEVDESSLAWSFARLIHLPNSVSKFYVSKTRVYSPGLGEWLSVDPSVWDPKELVSHSGNFQVVDYAYSDPINEIDPSGRFGVTALLVGALAGLIINEVAGFGYSGLEAELIGAVAAYFSSAALTGMVGTNSASIGIGLKTGLSIGTGMGVGGSMGGVTAWAIDMVKGGSRVFLWRRSLDWCGCRPSRDPRSIFFQ